MFAIDVVETDVLILGIDLKELTHKVIVIVHDDLLSHRRKTVTKLHRLEGERQHLARFLDVVNRRGGIANLHRSVQLKIARLELRFARSVLERVELLLIQIELGTRSKTASLSLEHPDAYITAGLNLIEPKVGHLAGSVVVIGRAQVDRERPFLVRIIEQAVLAIRDIHRELLKGAVGTLDIAARVANRLEGTLRSLTAVNRQIDRQLLRIALTRAVARVIVGGEVAIDQRFVTAALVGGNGRARHGPALDPCTTELSEASSTSSSATFMYLFSLEGCQ